MWWYKTTATWINLGGRPISSSRGSRERGVWAVEYGSKKRSYGRLQARRRRLGVALVALVALLAALPFILKAPETVRQTIYPLEYEETIRKVSAEHDLEPTFVAAVVYTESRFRPDARSHRGAYGLMQLLPETAKFIQKRSGIEGDWRDPETNLRIGTWYLGYLEDRYVGDERLMLAAYNSGESQVDAWISDGGFDVGEDIPFKETREYVDNVLEARQTYEEIYGRNLYRNSQ
jgi:soluble lytic murein transglycosylase